MFVNGKELESVDSFTYLGSIISIDNGPKDDINPELEKHNMPLSNSIQYGNQTTSVSRQKFDWIIAMLNLYNCMVQNVGE